jgi:hypothetical protein
MGHMLLVAGIIEGAALIGWRLTQLPKSQPLEFLLVSALSPYRVMLGETLVGISRLGLITLSGLPLLVLSVVNGDLESIDLVPLLLMPFSWGLITGLGLIWWSYEPAVVRRWVERATLASVLLYIGVGFLAGEHLRLWLARLPESVGHWLLNGFVAIHRYNPFGVMEFWLTQDAEVASTRMWGLQSVSLVVGLLLLIRSVLRLKSHFDETHYRPAVVLSKRNRGEIGKRPLSWWAVKRVQQFPGRINVWLAGGFGVLYAVYTLSGSRWPPWMGREVFAAVDRAGGLALLATALVILAAVPAAFQYGLWDSNAQDRCRRLELLLLTRLEAKDYWRAAAAAAWRRGRGYFAVAVLLWTAAAASGRIGLTQGIVALAAGVVVWGLYFTLGFGAFSRGQSANALGMMLTIGLPLLVYGCYRAGWSPVAAALPPGSIYAPAVGAVPFEWLGGPLLGGCATLCLARFSLRRCDSQLRLWYASRTPC